MRENMGDHVAVLESQYASPVVMHTDFDDSTKIAKMMATFRESREYEVEPLIA